jgi:hypothetical protein
VSGWTRRTRSKATRTLLALCVLGLPVLGGCGTEAGEGREGEGVATSADTARPPNTVEIYLLTNDDGTRKAMADPPALCAFIGNNLHFKGRHKGDTTWAVTFTDSTPLQNEVMRVPSGNNPQAPVPNPLKNGVEEDYSYPYVIEITLPDGTTVSDPEIVIKRPPRTSTTGTTGHRCDP